MLQLKIGDKAPIDIDIFIETKDFVDRPEITTIRVEFENAYPFGEDSINKLAEMFKSIPYLVLFEDNQEMMRIDGEITLYRIAREARRRKIITSVQLTYLPNDIIK